MSAQAPIPNTPAGQALRAWFAAYNSGNQDRVQTFLQKFEPSMSSDGMMAFRSATGDLEVIAIDKADRTHITFRVKQLATSKTAVGELQVTDAAPAQIVKLNFAGLQVLPSDSGHKR